MKDRDYTRHELLECSLSLLEGVEERIRTKTELVDTLMEALADTGDVALLNYARSHRFLPHLRPHSYEVQIPEREYTPDEVRGFIRQYYSDDLELYRHLRTQENLLADIKEYKVAIARGEE